MHDITNTTITPEQFGKDHWALLAYVETTCVDGANGFGHLDRSKMRCNEHKHPAFKSVIALASGWKLSYSSRLYGFFEFAERNDPEKAIEAGLQLRDHDDWDCLEDLAAAGYVKVLSLANAFIRMTDEGLRVTALLRAHKANGGQYAGFVLEPAAA